jgi:hypothetical protein
LCTTSHAMVRYEAMQSTDGLISMSLRLLRMSISAFAVAAAFGGVAHAGFYGDNFDPPFFSGGVTFEIGDNCKSIGNGVQTANTAFCNPVRLVATPAPVVTLNDGTHTSTLVFDGVPNLADMTDVAVIGGQVVGIDTNFLGGFQAANTTYFPDWYFIQFGFIPTYRFTEGVDRDSEWFDGFADDGKTLVSVVNTVTLLDCPHNYLSSTCTSYAATTVTFAPVPEPGTLGLILGGLGVAWWGRRRKAA